MQSPDVLKSVFMGLGHMEQFKSSFLIADLHTPEVITSTTPTQASQKYKLFSFVYGRERILGKKHISLILTFSVRENTVQSMLDSSNTNYLQH